MASRKTLVPPTRAELRILHALWDIGQATVEDVINHPSFPTPPNYKTTQTILRIMEDKGLAHHTSRGRVFVFEPLVTREQVGRLSVRTLLDQNFGGSPAKLLVNLLETGTVNEAELDELEALIQKFRAHKGEAAP